MEAAEGQVLEGDVTKWNEQSAFGWIQAQGLDKEVFAHKEEVLTGQDLSVNQHLYFTLGRDAKSGRWRARGIADSPDAAMQARAAGQPPQGGASAPVQPRQAMPAKRPAPQSSGLVMGGGAGERDLDEVEGQQLVGVVTKWKANSAFGFLQAEGYKEIFAHKEEVVGNQDLAAGMYVTFTVGRDAKSGKWRSFFISPAVGSPEKRPRLE